LSGYFARSVVVVDIVGVIDIVVLVIVVE